MDHSSNHVDKAGNHSDKAGQHYGLLGVMAVLHFGAMFALMYAMVNIAADALPNLNQAYMAGLMTAPMLIFEVLLMGSMYRRKRINMAILAGGAILLVGAFLLIRQQTAITDAQFLRSMIPHHSGAILMCEKAPLDDPEIKELCGQIIASQQSEIDWMRRKLESM